MGHIGAFVVEQPIDGGVEAEAHHLELLGVARQGSGRIGEHGTRDQLVEFCLGVADAGDDRRARPGHQLGHGVTLLGGIGHDALGGVGGVDARRSATRSRIGVSGS